MQTSLDYSTPFATLDDWVIYKTGTFTTGLFTEEFVVVSLASEPLSTAWLNAADAASRVRQLLPGVKFEFKSEPECGFVWWVERGWELTDARLATRKLETLLREIQRFSGGLKS